VAFGLAESGTKPTLTASDIAKSSKIRAFAGRAEMGWFSSTAIWAA